MVVAPQFVIILHKDYEGLNLANQMNQKLGGIQPEAERKIPFYCY